MNKQQILRRYALALALVPEQDAADDLFMDAADESDLRARANRLRHANGLSPIQGDPPELPALDEMQVEYALHLAERAAYRRRSRRMLTVVGLAVVLVGLAYAGVSLGPGQFSQLSAPLLGLFLLGAGIWLTARRADPGAWLLAAWGVLLELNVILSITLGRLWIPASQAEVARIQRIAAASSVVYMLCMWGTAVYVVWRLWPRQVTPRWQSR
ncbi:MAG TPA: hypothetical protein VNT75_14810 [Symbiobacteriaceae bacterium]|nr:hypothetical protein [Symbiobacteriaceae bacterium]